MQKQISHRQKTFILFKVQLDPLRSGSSLRCQGIFFEVRLKGTIKYQSKIFVLKIKEKTQTSPKS